MRKIKLTLQCRVPSWNYCTLDGFTTDGRYSKELCRFCVKTKTGHRCLLFDQDLTTGPKFVNKVPQCIEATAGFAVTADEPTPIKVDPKVIIRESLKSYKKTVSDLVSQGYPQSLAETLATKYTLGEK